MALGHVLEFACIFDHLFVLVNEVVDEDPDHLVVDMVRIVEVALDSLCNRFIGLYRIGQVLHSIPLCFLDLSVVILIHKGLAEKEIFRFIQLIIVQNGVVSVMSGLSGLFKSLLVLLFQDIVGREIDRRPPAEIQRLGQDMRLLKVLPHFLPRG